MGFSGYKTYLIAIAIGAVTAVRALNLIDDNTAELLMMLLTGSGLATLRLGIQTDMKKAASTAQKLERGGSFKGNGLADKDTFNGE